jgi:hypothetical protein
MLNYGTCLDGYNTTRKECSKMVDEGYSKCESWSQDCVSASKECVVSWIPFIGPAICKVFEWVCRAFQWVCKAAVWIAHMVCHAWNFITTFVCTVWETVVVIVFVVGTFVKFILAIPIVGAIIKEVINFFTGLIIGLIGLVVEGFFCGLLGICAPKKLRVCVIHNIDADASKLQPILDRTKQILKDEANVTVYAQTGTGAGGLHVDAECGASAWGQDLGLIGSQYERAASLNCMEYTVPSIIGLGSPIYAFAVKDIAGRDNGCSLWFLTNYVVFETVDSCGNNTHLAHEIGHACGLTHPLFDDSDSTNLMHSKCVNPGRDQLSTFQKSIVRGSKYVTYF